VVDVPADPGRHRSGPPPIRAVAAEPTCR